MATNFPTSLDALTNPTGANTLASPDHAGQHSDANDAIEALQAKVGVDSSAVVTSLDYMVGLKANLASPTFTGTVTVPTPVNATDAATKSYADAITQSLDIKDSVRVASTVNIAVASALINGSTIDGVVVATGERVLLKNQTTGAQNGIYVVVASGAASRSTDADTSAKVTSGMYVFVSEGTVSADMGYVLTTNDPITLGTTSLAFTQFSGAGQITAGTGITKSGNTLSVDTTVIAALASPTFTGTPILPTGTIATTQTAGNSTTAVATTAFVTTADNLKANLASPTFSGTPTLPTGTIATTQTAADSSTKVATTAFVTTADNLKANLASPTFTGTVTMTKPVINGTNPTGATYAPSSGAQTVALDCSANNMHIVSGNASGTAITFTVSNATNNQPFIVSILQGGTTVSTISAWFATVRWAGGSIPVLTATLNKRDTFGFIRTGANTYDGFIIGQNC